MNDPSHQEELITRWIDGELSAIEQADVARRLENEPGFAAEVDAATAGSRTLGDLLRAEFPAGKEPPSPELFNARIMSHVQSESLAAALGEDNVVRPAFGVWRQVPWFIAAAAVFVAALIVIQQRPSGTPLAAGSATSEVSNSYAPRQGVEIHTRVVPEAGATVVSLEGLDTIPSTHEIEGELVASRLPSGTREAPVFASAATGQPLFVLLTDAFDVPSIMRVHRN